MHAALDSVKGPFLVYGNFQAYPRISFLLIELARQKANITPSS